eukprot:sb/3462871/
MERVFPTLTSDPLNTFSTSIMYSSKYLHGSGYVVIGAEVGVEERLNTISESDLLPARIKEQAARDVKGYPKYSHEYTDTDKCAVTGHMAGCIPDYKVNRIMFRNLAHKGQISGLKYRGNKCWLCVMHRQLSSRGKGEIGEIHTFTIAIGSLNRWEYPNYSRWDKEKLSFRLVLLADKDTYYKKMVAKLCKDDPDFAEIFKRRKKEMKTDSKTDDYEWWHMVLWVLLFHSVSAHYFDADEVNFLKYNLEITAKPILRKEVPESSLRLKSKYLQEYSCSLPEVNFKQDEQLEHVFAISPKLLRDKHCVFRTKGYWTYKLCFGDSIVQYHVDHPSKTREVPKEHTVIGTFEDDFNFFEKLQNTKIRYYEQLPRNYKQYYGGGDICDENGGHTRKAIVTFVCDMDTVTDFIAKIDEKELCVYKIVVHTSRMCLHPFFYEGQNSLRHKISCRPIVADMAPALPNNKKKEVKTPPAPVSEMTSLGVRREPVQPNWVGANPSSPYHDLKSYIDELLDEEKQGPIRLLKQMFRDALKQLKKDFTDAKDARASMSSDPVLSQIDLDKISDADMDALFKSEELPNGNSKYNSNYLSPTAGSCTGEHGFVVAVTTIDHIGNGVIDQGQGSVNFPVKYKAIVFRPFKGEYSSRHGTHSR